MHAADPDSTAIHAAARPARPRWPRLAMLTVAALLLHAATVGGLDLAWPTRPSWGGEPGAVQVRVIGPVAAPVIIAEPALPSEPPIVTTPRRVTAVEARRPARAATTARSTLPSDAMARVEPSAIAEPAPAALPTSIEVDAEVRAEAIADTSPPLALLAVAATDPTPTTATGDEPIPHYRNKPPPPLTLRYDLQRGMLRGTGQLLWRPQGDRYELRLEGKVGSLPVITQVSTGGIDATGLMPVRFTDQRLSRAATAVNFQREAGKITFSGPSTEYPMHEGVQDRLSWMIQLASIVTAEPRLRKVDAKVVMWVVGSHGEASAWVFRCVGPEPVEMPGGAVETVKFVREPRDPFDANVQVWLDPQRSSLPVRATQQSGPKDEPFELRLQAVLPTP